MKYLLNQYRNLVCRYCGKPVYDVGSGTNMGGSKPMCERCHEHGGDDE